MGVGDAGDAGKLAVQDLVGFGVGGGVELPVHDLPFQVHDHHGGGSQLVVDDAGRLDGEDALGRVERGHVAPGIDGEGAAGNLHVGLVGFVPQGLE